MDKNPGIYPDITFENYLKIQAENKSQLVRMNESPQSYKWHKENPSPQTPQMIRGSAVDALIFLQDADKYVHDPMPRSRSKDAVEARKELEKQGKVILSEDDWALVTGARDAVLGHPIAGKLIDSGDSQLTVVWNDLETGIKCKARPDLVVENLGTAIDLKTTGQPISEFQKSIANFFYHVQAAMYLDGLSMNSCYLKHWLFIVVEMKPPHGVAVFALEDEDIIRGRALYSGWLRKLHECRLTGEYPGYEPVIKPIGLPAWARR